MKRVRPDEPSSRPIGMHDAHEDDDATPLTPAALLRRIGLRTTLGRIYILQLILDNPQQRWDTTTVCRWMAQAGTEIDRGSVYRTLRACHAEGVLVRCEDACSRTALAYELSPKLRGQGDRR